jgi:hypothetical protein
MKIRIRRIRSLVKRSDPVDQSVALAVLIALPQAG